MSRIRLLVVQPTPFCNIDCRYCYLPNRSDKSVVAPGTLVNLFTQVFEAGWVRDRLSVVWHAGEPLVLSPGFYRDAFRTIERLKPPDLEIQHSFQTNGTLIDEAWCAFFAEEDVNLGLSIDGPRQFHDLNRRTRSGRGTFDKTIAGVRLLRARDVPFHVISVLTAASMAEPRAMLDFYLAEAIEHVCFNIEESEGAHASEALGDAGAAAAYYRFLGEFWRLAAASEGRIASIREIDTALAHVLRPKEATYFNELVEPFAITSMDCAGNLATFSPELLGLKDARYADFIIGNVNRDRLTEIEGGEAFRHMRDEIAAGVAMCRERCGYFSVCGGGEPVNKLTENGSFASAETAYCRVAKMRGIDVVLDALERRAGAGSPAPVAAPG